MTTPEQQYLRLKLQRRTETLTDEDFLTAAYRAACLQQPQDRDCHGVARSKAMKLRESYGLTQAEEQTLKDELRKGTTPKEIAERLATKGKNGDEDAKAGPGRATGNAATKSGRGNARRKRNARRRRKSR